MGVHMEFAQSSGARLFLAAASLSSSIRYLPVSLFGAVMSVAGLSLAWRLAGKAYGIGAELSNIIGIVALALFAVLVLAYVSKFFRYPQVVKMEFLHPVGGSFFGTVGISILLLSSVIGVYSGYCQLIVWTIGSVVTLTLSAIMISRLLHGNAAPATAVPAWLIGGVGSLDVVVTGGAFMTGWQYQVNLLAAAIGGVSAVVFFIRIFSRIVHEAPLAEAMQPSMMILVAPFPVGFIAYVNLVQRVDAFAALLFYFGLFLFAVISGRLLMKPPPFSPAWWAVGFPVAALTGAALMYAGSVGTFYLGVIAALLLIALSIGVFVLAVRTVFALFTGRLLNV